MAKKVTRLYQQFKPEHYDLFLECFREAGYFRGKVVIRGQKTGRPSQRLTLHQKGLKIVKASLVHHGKNGQSAIAIGRINTQKSFDELRLHSKQQLYPGDYTIEIHFAGKITEPMHGIYPCDFQLAGRKKQLIATQFESHHAREAFPCIDEPEAKATYKLTISVPAAESVISNTPVETEEKSGKNKIVSFKKTPKMSSYLLAFAYGELGYKETKSKNGVSIRVYATPDKVDLTDFALDAAKRSLEFFEDYFGVPYPLPKLDLIGLPDFSAGAMENWGLITFREQVLFVDPDTSSIETKQYVAMVVAHEISHQWFGNLVTMRWWNDLWLNESFANLMEYRAVDELFPEWKIWQDFAAREVGSALSRDALPNVQPVQVQVSHPDELGALFDPSIVYAKGGSLLNMVRHLVGEAAFRAGLKTYFSEFKYTNTTASDLWRHIGKAAGIDIEKLMDKWLTKPGFPVVSVDYQPGAKTVSARQKRLVIGERTGTDSTIWQVPLAASMDLDQPILAKASVKFEIKNTGSYPLTLNHDGRSYFASHYLNHEHFGSILSAVKDNSLSPIDRLLLVQSYLLLERAGQVPTLDNLRLLQAYKNERDETVWGMLAGIIGNVRTLAGKDQALEAKINRFVRPLAAPLVKELGWQGKPADTSQTQKLRALGLSLAAGAADPGVIKEGLKRFKAFRQPADLAPDIRSVVYFIAVRYGTKSDFEKLLKLYSALSSADEKEEVAAELTATREPGRIEQLLTLVTSKEVRLQDAPTWFAWLMRNRYATDLTWQWLVDNWDWVASKYGDDKSYDRFPRYAAMAFSYPDQFTDYKKFFGPKANIALARPIKLGVEEISGRLLWRARNEQPVKDWLNRSR